MDYLTKLLGVDLQHLETADASRSYRQRITTQGMQHHIVVHDVEEIALHHIVLAAHIDEDQPIRILDDQPLGRQLRPGRAQHRQDEEDNSDTDETGNEASSVDVSSSDEEDEGEEDDDEV